ncbi:MAG: methionine adenosyltransferase [Gemmatimonadetes bacterium]|nr:methionine adenosyltransferase [Gemmatimonadota bacterium]MYA10489.1 methionine adenosyltransferase [Gemmatimonadota bacterium]MYE68439.1 methionine adenosyltransferase [Gemmatimonadota bacterium]MYJ69935.1 methionine adenosyltransferase [Gemmatimonadota bacterium]
MSRLFTSESVTEGHPDKIADQISDAIVDAVLERDPGGRVACETLVTTGLALIAGEMRSGSDAAGGAHVQGALDIPGLVRETIRATGYTRADHGIDGDTCAVLTTLDRQSPEIAAAVDPGEGDDAKPLGAGDQGMMFGFACDDTPELMPAPISVAHALVRGLSRARRSGEISWLRPDGKSQVTFEYGDDWRPRRIRTVVLSAQHDQDIPREQLCRELMEKVVLPALPGRFLPGGIEGVTFHINPSGSFVLGGPHGDAGLTGRKIIVDTYGGFGRHGGGAFSGKDATKVDRSGAYAARWAARNLVAAGAAKRCEVQLAYAIGVAEPVQVWVDSFGTAAHGRTDRDLSHAVREVFDFRPESIIRDLGLAGPVFSPTAAFGHFGRTPEIVQRKDRRIQLFGWERTNRVDELTFALKLPSHEAVSLAR